eukprot:53957-Hanusia_phi.AAC.1
MSSISMPDQPASTAAVSTSDTDYFTSSAARQTSAASDPVVLDQPTSSAPATTSSVSMLDQPATTPAVSTAANPERPWPSKQLQGVEACAETREWKDLIPVKEAGQMMTGGLGKLLVEEEVE